MKSEFTLIVVATSLAWASGNQSTLAQAPPNATVVERGPHHRVIERTLTETRLDGTTAQRKSSYTELATGLHYKNELGEWIESREEIEIFQGAAVARQGQHSVIFAAQLNSPGAIDLLSPDGKRFRSHVIGLAYTDAASGRSVMIAETKDSIGAVLPPNQVIYQDAFAGDCVADVRFTYTLGGFEQDIILLTAPPSPAQWNLDPDTTRLEVFTEFLEVPDGTATDVVLKQESDPVLRQQMAEPDLIDQRLDFGVMKVDQGQAFPLGESDPFGGAAVPTGKSMERIDGRVFLIEKVDYRDVREQLKALPQHAAVNPRRKINEPVAGRRMFAGLLPTPKGERGAWKEKQFAQVGPRRKGFVLDYVTLNGSLTNQIFRGDSTYSITNSVNLYGVTVIEGGAVLKYSTNSSLYVNSTLDCRTGPYRPAIFTCKDDNTVGEIITGSTGNPLGYSANIPLGLKDTSATYQLSGLWIRCALYAVNLYTGVKADFSHVQFASCGHGPAWLSGTLGTWRNFLFTDMPYAFYASGNGTNRAEHGTLHRVGSLLSNTNSGYLLTLTNSLLISVTNNVVYAGVNVISSLDDTGIFQTIGTGAHYLAGGSTNRNSGTTNINATLLADLKNRTTYPPIVLSNYIASDTSLIAQAGRDTDTPDLGYHYDALDYACGGVAVTNATLFILPGTAVAVYGPVAGPGPGYGIATWAGSRVICEGTPDRLNRLVNFATVQEQANTNWSSRFVITLVGNWLGGTAPSVRVRFTEWSTPAADTYHLDASYLYAETLDLTDCQFSGGYFNVQGPQLNVTNCLFRRLNIFLDAIYTNFNANFRNCLFYGGVVDLERPSTNTWLLKDNLFDATSITTNGTYTADYNAYTTNVVRLPPWGANDVALTVTNFSYDTGPLGTCYQPTNSALLDKGSYTNAALAGFYHYTTLTRGDW